MSSKLYIHPQVPAYIFDADKEPRQAAVLIVMGPGHTSTKRGNLAGKIKTVRFGPHTQSPMLAPPAWLKRDGRIFGVESIRLSDEEERMGSRFLRDLYKEEGRLSDYDEVVAREIAIRQQLEVPDVPESFLPEIVRSWRHGTAKAKAFKFSREDEPEAKPAPVVRKAKPEPSGA